MNLILWDVDGTLLRAGPVAAQVFVGAIADVTGHDPGGHGVAMSGKTDPQITIEILQGMGYDDDAARRLVPAVLERLVARLSRNVERIQREGRVLPGVPELLAALAEQEPVRQTLLTGNVEANARTKTAALGLEGWFDWRLGSFGSDHGDRRQLVPLARERAVAALGAAPQRVWVIGDTPHDLACARAGGAGCVLVATGRFGRDELDGLGADAVVDDVTDTDALVELLAT